MGARQQSKLVIDAATPVVVATEDTAYTRHSMRALLLGLLLWLVVRPILRHVRDLVSVRRRMERLDSRAPFRDGHRAELGGIPVHVAECANAQRVVLYIHGGGFFMRPSGAHASFMKQLCVELDAVGVMPDYRLSPEHPYPYGLDDCMHAYESLLAHGVPANSIVLVGESAGGTLCLALLLRLRDAKQALPACAVVISPGTDLAGVGIHASYHENGARDALVPPDALPRIVEAYAGDNDTTNPLISPLHGDFSGLPPLHFVASHDEVMRDDSVLAVDKARAAGVTTELKLWRGLMHAFPLFHRLPESQAARADITSFIRQHTATPGVQQIPTFIDEVLP